MNAEFIGINITQLTKLKESGKSNILLIGLPGSGKTTVGKLLASKLKCSVYDVDDHHLESVWGCSVADKLTELGDYGFLEAEGHATKQISKSNSIISLTGSNPLNSEAMRHLKKEGYVIYLESAHESIVERCEKMRVNRIVGQSSYSLSDIL